MSQGFEGYIDEYNQLRAEIRMYLEHGTKSLQIAMALGAAAVTFGVMAEATLVVEAQFSPVREDGVGGCHQTLMMKPVGSIQPIRPPLM